MFHFPAVKVECKVFDDDELRSGFFSVKLALSVSLDSGGQDRRNVFSVLPACPLPARVGGPGSAAPNLPMLIRTPRFCDC